MGTILKLFGYKPNKDIINNNNEDEKFEMIENKNCSILKIHICGVGERKKRVIDLLFRKKISTPDLISRGDSEYKSDDFYWITKIYKDEIINENFIAQLEKDIEFDKTGNTGEEEAEEEEHKDFKKINFHVMLCFGDENDIDMLLNDISDINKPRIILVSKKRKELENKNFKKYVKNIIDEGMDDNELNNNIVSSLWELDCYYNEKGNEILRHSPINIVNGLQTDMSFFSINILLTGMCRSGKSSFINLISEKLVALETNDTESVTTSVSQYYIYRKDNKQEHGAIKLIDTPGICEDNEINSKTLNIIKDFINNKHKNIEKQIHFILFFFMDGATLGHSENLLKILNDNYNNYPAFFVINKSQDTSWKGKAQDIKSKMQFLKRKNCGELAKEENFIQVNIKSKSGKFYGVDDIFKKIEKYINDKQLLSPQVLKEMNDIQDEYRRKQNFNNIYIDIKENFNAEESAKQMIESLQNNNLLFKDINLNNIKAHGRKIARQYEKSIISLSNLKNIFPVTLKDIPIISFLQAFMIKEIGAAYGFDFNTVNFCFKEFDKDIKKFKLKGLINNEENNKIIDEINVYNNEIIDKQRNELTSKINNIWETSNEEVIKRLVERIHELTSLGNNTQNDENKINIENTIAISSLCQNYFEKELDETNGLPFYIYYFKKNLSLMEDIKYYIGKKDWEKDEVEILEKKNN